MRENEREGKHRERQDAGPARQHNATSREDAQHSDSMPEMHHIVIAPGRPSEPDLIRKPGPYGLLGRRRDTTIDCRLDLA